MELWSTFLLTPALVIFKKFKSFSFKVIKLKLFKFLENFCSKRMDLYEPVKLIQAKNRDTG